MGAAAPEEEEEDPSALGQQREVGGDAGGGRPENGGASRERRRGKLHPGRHEHRKPHFEDPLTRCRCFDVYRMFKVSLRVLRRSVRSLDFSFPSALISLLTFEDQ